MLQKILKQALLCCNFSIFAEKLLDSGVFGYSAEEKEKVVFLQRSRSRSILAAENIAKDGDAPATNGQITVVI